MQKATSAPPVEDQYKAFLLCIAEIIKQARRSANKSLGQLAFECQPKKASISRIEAGKTNITFFTLYKIGIALNFSIADLVGDAQPMQSIYIYQAVENV